jgi:hypothetical protein
LKEIDCAIHKVQLGHESGAVERFREEIAAFRAVDFV